MTWEAAARLARALLYEGYVLYPYRGSALKNQRRWAFGTLYPPAFCTGGADRSFCRTEVLVCGEAPRLRAVARFLQPIERRDPGSAAPWLEARERDVELGPVPAPHLSPGRSRPFHLPGEAWTDRGASYRQEEAFGRLDVAAIELAPELFRLRVELHDVTELPRSAASRDEAYLRSLASAHVLLGCEEGRFVSLLEPPQDLAEAARACDQAGLFPVLVGPPGYGGTMLASPIILYDHPRIAPESPGDLYDATEIDELLSLRILTLTEAEKCEAAATDPRARAILERTEGLGWDELAAMHGARRDADVRAGLRPGDKVRLRPARGGDVFDLALDGEAATVCAVEQDIEGTLFFAVTVDADPAADLGLSGQPGHRFFFRESELEPIR